MLEPTAALVHEKLPRMRHVGATRLAALALVTIASACGGGDPSQSITSLRSAAETARLTVGERLDNAISERYASGMLESLASTLPEVRSTLAEAPLDAALRRRALDDADALRAALEDARLHDQSRSAAAARLDGLARSLDTLARAAGAKED